MILRPYFIRSLRIWHNCKINYSSVPDELTFIKNGMIICWHREPKFPYDCSKPLPKVKSKPESVLKITDNETYKLFSKEKPRAVTADELAKMTHTTKHIWFPRARDKKNIRIEPDRPYL